MSLPTPFDRFVFNERLEKELKVFIDNPQALPEVTCLWGYPGIGKTSFAKEYSSHFASNETYHPMNEITGNLTETFKKNLPFNKKTATLETFMDDSDSPKKVIGHVAILDEFHNLSGSKQDYFKTVFDEMNSRSDWFRIFLCINTDMKRPTPMSVLSGPIFSRCHHIDFNTSIREKDAYVNRLCERFTDLKKNEIACWLPDVRRIERENRIRSLSPK
jgi:replication-associated recombination protein RarA